MISDIDEQRQYRTTLLALTDRRIYSSGTAVGEWPLTDVEKLKTKDRAGLGTLEMLGYSRRLSYWHYTIAQGPAALVFGDRFEDVKGGHAIRKHFDEEEIPEGEEQVTPPDTMALFRLWRFAKPHAWWMFVAFVLSLSATIADVETAKMTRPLINLLTQYESAKISSRSPAIFYLGIMLGGGLGARGNSGLGQ
jgi:ATP-binding cassette subfamily B protein